ncbi:hypothetical protein GQ457_02G028790 [Hibiscus cannabinus]
MFIPSNPFLTGESPTEPSTACVVDTATTTGLLSVSRAEPDLHRTRIDHRSGGIDAKPPLTHLSSPLLQLVALFHFHPRLGWCRHKFTSHPPSHYMFKIESFSLLAEANVEYFKSDTFESGGHRRLVLYPNGNEKSNGSGHISLYLEIVIEETGDFSLDWEVNVDFKLFVFDQIRDQYLAIKDMEVSVRRFYEMKKEWGFSQLLSQEAFKNGDNVILILTGRWVPNGPLLNTPNNGYLVEDCCIFGAELLIIETPPELEQLSMVKNPSGGTITWKIENSIRIFTILLYNPYFMVYPKGSLQGEGTHLSLFLALVEPDELPPQRQVYVKYNLRLRDQIKSNHFEFKAPVEKCYDISAPSWGYPKFVRLKDLKDTSKGYMVNDSLIVEAELLLISTVE